jgi:hypothetical protein
MPDLATPQKPWLILLRLFIGIFAATFLFFLYTTIHFDSISPTAADESSGHIYRSYDKIHGRYVYLDKTAKDSELNFAWISGTLGFCSVLVGLKVNDCASGK